MKYSILFIMLCFHCTAQVAWFESNGHEWKDHISNEVWTIDASSSQNYNSIAQLQDSIEIDFNKLGLKQCHIFSVFIPRFDAVEELIWKLESESEDKVLLTNARMADVENRRFLNFLDYKVNAPQVNNYIHNIQSFKADKISIGGFPNNTNIPVSKFKGHLGEIVIFNKALSPISSKIVEGHLALKYGIQLRKTFDYYNAKAQVIWDSSVNEKYTNNIGGLGYEPGLKFNQKQSKTPFGSGDLTVFIGEKSDLNVNNQYRYTNAGHLIWGSSLEPFLFYEKYKSVKELKKAWLFENVSFDQNNSLSFSIHNDKLGEELKSKNLWMIIDPAYPQNNINERRYIKFLSEDHIYNATNVNIGEGKSRVSFLSAPAFWSDLNIVNGSCLSNTLSIVEGNIVSGLAPYLITMTDDEGNVLKQQEQTQYFKIENLDAGSYTLRISDSNGKEWQTEFFTNSLELNVTSLREVYDVSEWNDLKEKLKNDLGQDVIYLKTESGTWNLNEIGQIDPGQYQLTVERGSCIFHKNISFKSFQSAVDRFVTYPNPSPNGLIKVEVDLKAPFPCKLQILDLLGKEIDAIDIEDELYLRMPIQLPGQGSYFLTLITPNEVISKKVIVVQP